MAALQAAVHAVFDRQQVLRCQYGIIHSLKYSRRKQLQKVHQLDRRFGVVEVHLSQLCQLLQALRTSFVRTSAGVKQRITPSGTPTQLLPLCQLPAGMASEMENTHGSCQAVGGEPAVPLLIVTSLQRTKHAKLCAVSQNIILIMMRPQDHACSSAWLAS